MMGAKSHGKPHQCSNESERSKICSRTIHPARSDQKYQSPNCANMAYIFENYIPVETFWCKIWIDTCTILGIGLIFTTVAPIFD